MTNYFDKKNQEAYERNTQKLISALNDIKKNPKLKVTISQLVKITGLHRNTIRNRTWIKEKLGEIKAERKAEKSSERLSKGKIAQKTTLEEKHKLLKKELVYWFCTCSNLNKQVHQLRINLERVSEARCHYENMLIKERTKVEKLNDHIKSLNLIISSSAK